MKINFDYKNIRKIGLVTRRNINLKAEILELKKILDEKNIELI